VTAFRVELEKILNRRQSAPIQLLRASTGADKVMPRLGVLAFRACCHRFRRLGNAYYLVLAFAVAYGQQGVSGPDRAGHPETTDKHAFGILPNYRTADASQESQPISPRQKMAIAAKDSFDWTLLLVAAGYAGLGQLTNQNPSFEQGTKGYANRFVRAYSDQVLGNMLTEGVMPSILHEDPRYFRLGQGTFWHRVKYAGSRIFLTRTDSGGARFNYSEVVGNFVATGISNAYYPGSRNLGANVQKITWQLATDAISNVLKEFWPDVKHKLRSPPSP
jgi:hypothetical protein